MQQLESKQPLKSQTVVDILKKAQLLLEVRMNDPEQVFSRYTTDSRGLGADELFIAYRGVSFDAHILLPVMSQSPGSLGLIIDQAASWPEAQKFGFACLVKDSREAWAALAAYRYGQPQDKLQLLGVTGTNGKTSTVWYIRQILRALGEECLTIGTLGIYLGDEKLPATHTTPDPDELFRALALAVERGYRWAAMEVSSHAVVQKRLGPLRFDAVAFASFSRDHLDFHASMEEYFAAKWEFIAHFRKPGGTAWLSHSLGEWKPANAASLGCRSYGPDEAMDLSYSIEAMQLGLTKVKLQLGHRQWQGELAFAGDFAVENFAVAWVLVKSVSGLVLEPLQWHLVQAVPGRFEPIASAFAQDLAVIVDYAHTPDALEKTLMKLRDLTPGKIWVIFGCGGDRDRGKRPMMGRIAEQWADHVVLTSDNPRSEDPLRILEEIAAGMHHPERALRVVDRREAIARALGAATAGDSLLIAGKGHEDYQIIGTRRLDFDDKKVAEEILQAQAAQ